MPNLTKTPSLPTRNIAAIMTSCAAFAVSACFAGGMWLVMR